MRELKFEIRDADPAYVEEKVGAELYVHLRAVPTIVDFRRRSLERAYERYCACDDAEEGRRGALGLLVLQRAMLAVEDLGGLLYALAEPSFERLVSYELPDIGASFARLFSDASATPDLYRLVTADAVDAEPGLDEVQRRAMKKLAAITQTRIDAELVKVERFWQAAHDEAKKTMHGVAFLEGRYAVEEPGAGMISRLVARDHSRPFALPLTTRVDHAGRHVNTEVGALALTAEAVRDFREAGLAACTATELLVSGRLHGLETNHAYTLPLLYLDQLDADDREALAPLLAT